VSTPRFEFKCGKVKNMQIFVEKLVFQKMCLSAPLL